MRFFKQTQRLSKLAYRNIWRRKTRAFTTIGAMALAGALMIFYAALLEGFVDVLERNLIMMNIGDAQIHKEGYLEDPDIYTTIEGYEEILAGLDSAGFKAAPRLFGFGLAAYKDNSAGVSLAGVDIEREKLVTQTYKHISAGQWLDDNDPSGVVIGMKLAKTLDVELGGELVLVSQASDGSMANDLYFVRGILKGVGEVVDRGSLFMTQDALREFMAIPEGTHEIVILRNDREEPLESAMERITPLAGDNQTKSWKQIQPVMASVLEMTNASTVFMLLIMYAAVGMVTLNAMLMSVFERIREFGIMKALGVSPFMVMSIVMMEALIQAVIASVMAMAGGLAVSSYYEKHGIDLSGLSDGLSLGGVTMDPIWYCHINAKVVFLPIATLVAIIFIAVIYPGIKAAVIRPVEAIHHV